MLVVLVQADGNAALAVLDGATLVELARAVLPFHLATGFHGAFIPAL